LSVIRLLNNGSWNKPPVLTAARKVLIDGLADNWQRTELGDLATFVNGTSYDRGLLADSGTPIIRISNMTDPRSEYLTTNQSFDAKYVVQPNDLLVSWSASFKTVVWPGPVGILNQHIFKVTEKPGNHRGFIRHAIEAVFDDMQSKVVGIGMMHLRRRDFLGYPIPAPDYHTQEAVCRFLDWLETPDDQPEPPLPAQLSEQRRIVAWIEELAARIEEARGLRRQAVEEADALVQAARRKLIGAAPLPDWVPLNFYVRRIENGWSPSCENRPATGGEWGVLKVGSVSFGVYDPFENKALPTTLKPKPEYEVLSGDFLMSRANTKELVGACTLVDQTRSRLMLSDKIFRFVFTKESPSERRYLDHVLKSPALRLQIERAATGTSPTMKNISKEKVLNLLLPQHDVADQRRIVAYLDDLQAKADSLKRMQADTAAELDALLPSVLDRAFKGKL
jgi:restriction endonuclease S subunit